MYFVNTKNNKTRQHNTTQGKIFTIEKDTSKCRKLVLYSILYFAHRIMVRKRK